MSQPQEKLPCDQVDDKGKTVSDPKQELLENNSEQLPPEVTTDDKATQDDLTTHSQTSGIFDLSNQSIYYFKECPEGGKLKVVLDGVSAAQLKKICSIKDLKVTITDASGQKCSPFVRRRTEKGGCGAVFNKLGEKLCRCFAPRNPPRKEGNLGAETIYTPQTGMCHKCRLATPEEKASGLHQCIEPTCSEAVPRSASSSPGSVSPGSTSPCSTSSGSTSRGSPSPGSASPCSANQQVKKSSSSTQKNDSGKKGTCPPPHKIDTDGQNVSAVSHEVIQQGSSECSEMVQCSALPGQNHKRKVYPPIMYACKDSSGCTTHMYLTKRTKQEVKERKERERLRKQGKEPKPPKEKKKSKKGPPSLYICKDGAGVDQGVYVCDDDPPKPPKPKSSKQKNKKKNKNEFYVCKNPPGAGGRELYVCSYMTEDESKVNFPNVHEAYVAIDEEGRKVREVLCQTSQSRSIHENSECSSSDSSTSFDTSSDDSEGSDDIEDEEAEISTDLTQKSSPSVVILDKIQNKDESGSAISESKLVSPTPSRFEETKTEDIKKKDVLRKALLRPFQNLTSMPPKLVAATRTRLPLFVDEEEPSYLNLTVAKQPKEQVYKGFSDPLTRVLFPSLCPKKSDPTMTIPRQLTDPSNIICHQMVQTNFFECCVTGFFPWSKSVTDEQQYPQSEPTPTTCKALRFLLRGRAKAQEKVYTSTCTKECSKPSSLNDSGNSLVKHNRCAKDETTACKDPLVIECATCRCTKEYSKPSSPNDSGNSQVKHNRCAKDETTACKYPPVIECAGKSTAHESQVHPVTTYKSSSFCKLCKFAVSTTCSEVCTGKCKKESCELSETSTCTSEEDSKTAHSCKVTEPKKNNCSSCGGACPSKSKNFCSICKGQCTRQCREFCFICKGPCSGKCKTFCWSCKGPCSQNCRTECKCKDKCCSKAKNSDVKYSNPKSTPECKKFDSNSTKPPCYTPLSHKYGEECERAESSSSGFDETDSDSSEPPECKKKYKKTCGPCVPSGRGYEEPSKKCAERGPPECKNTKCKFKEQNSLNCGKKEPKCKLTCAKSNSYGQCKHCTAGAQAKACRCPPPDFNKWKPECIIPSTTCRKPKMFTIPTSYKAKRCCFYTRDMQMPPAKEKKKKKKQRHEKPCDTNLICKPGRKQCCPPSTVLIHPRLPTPCETNCFLDEIPT